jgi:hypothetical protein
LVLFAEVDLSLLERDYPVAPHSSLLRELDNLLARRNHVDHEAMFAAVSGLRPPDTSNMEEAWHQHGRYLDGTTCGSALRGMFSGGGSGQEIRALKTLHEVGRSLSPQGPLPNFGIRCPLGGFPASNASFWLDLLQRVLPLEVVPNVIWCKDSMLIYLNRLSSKALTALWHTSWQDNSLCDLATAEMEGELVNPIPRDHPLRSLLTARL